VLVERSILPEPRAAGKPRTRATSRRMQAALFDLDGTLVDNMEFHTDAWIALCARRGLPMARERFLLDFAGRKNEEILAELWPSLDAAGAHAVALEKEALYRSLYRPHLEALPGLLAFLDALEAKGLALAVATAAPPENWSLVLDGLGLRKRFRAVVGAADVKRGKPFPDLFLAAAQAVGAEPGECVAFEDAVLGVQAAVAAGMPTAGLTTTQTEAALRQAGARWVMSDFTLPPAELRSRLGLR
jgi:beta-phosphoglucomutase